MTTEDWIAHQWEKDNKPSLNGHYCLATKEHYDKLIENGVKIDIYRWQPRHYKYKYYLVHENEIVMCEDRHLKLTQLYGKIKPMHLHNNEWVFGSLEYDTDKEIDEYFASRPKKESHKLVREPKPVERITREEAERIHNESVHKHNTYFVKKMLIELFDYIEYLEANQRRSDERD